MPIYLCHARGWGHVTAVRFWGSTAPAISVSVGGSAPETVYQHRRMENVGLKNLREWEGGRLKRAC